MAETVGLKDGSSFTLPAGVGGGQNIGNISVGIVADAGGLKAGLLQANKALDTAQKGWQKNFGALADSFRNTGLTMMAMGGTLAAGLALSVRAANEAAASQVRLETAARNAATRGIALNTKAIESQASALQHLTGVQDETIMDMASLLATTHLQQQQIEKLLPTILDLSKAYGMDVESSARAMMKAMEGNSVALKKFGIIIDENLDPMKDFDKWLAQVTSRVHGAAEAFGKTGAGQLAIFRAEVDDLQEAIGDLVNKSLTPLIGKLTLLTRRITDVVKAFPGITKGVVGLTGALIGVGGLLAGLGLVAKALSPGGALLGGLMILRSFALNPITISVVLAIEGLADLFLLQKILREMAANRGLSPTAGALATLPFPTGKKPSTADKAAVDAMFKQLGIPGGSASLYPGVKTTTRVTGGGGGAKAGGGGGASGPTADERTLAASKAYYDQLDQAIRRTVEGTDDWGAATARELEWLNKAIAKYDAMSSAEAKAYATELIEKRRAILADILAKMDEAATAAEDAAAAEHKTLEEQVAAGVNAIETWGALTDESLPAQIDALTKVYDKYKEYPDVVADVALKIAALQKEQNEREIQAAKEAADERVKAGEREVAIARLLIEKYLNDVRTLGREAIQPTELALSQLSVNLTAAWEKLGGAMGPSSDEVKEKWQALRDAILLVADAMKEVGQESDKLTPKVKEPPKEMASEWEKAGQAVMDSIRTHFEDAIFGLIKGTSTLRDFWKSLWDDLLKIAIHNLITMVMYGQKAMGQMASGVSGIGGSLGGLTNKAGSWLGTALGIGAGWGTAIAGIGIPLLLGGLFGGGGTTPMQPVAFLGTGGASTATTDTVSTVATAAESTKILSVVVRVEEGAVQLSPARFDGQAATEVAQSIFDEIKRLFETQELAQGMAQA